MRLKFFEGILIIIPAAAITAFLSLWLSQRIAPYNYPPEIAQGTLSVVIIAVGDVMLDRGVEGSVNRNGGDFGFLFNPIAPLLQSAGITFANLESVISDRGQKVGSIYSFRANIEAAPALSQAGFDILSIANNHALDYTKEALEDSIKRLKAVGIIPLGGGFSKEACQGEIIEKHGMKIGFLAYTAVGSPLWQPTETTAGVCWTDEGNQEALLDNIQRMANQTDVLLLSMHWGDEYRSDPAESQIALAHNIIDAGVDIIIGHHPHVAQPLEKYRQGWIAYSLGNFIFDQDFSNETMQGLLLRITVKDKKIKSVLPEEISLNRFYQPELR